MGATRAVVPRRRSQTRRYPKSVTSERGPVLAVGGVVVRDGKLLMVRRAKEPGKGLWSIPGGRLERGEFIAAGVAREVKEETGLDVEVRELLGILEVPGETHYVILDHVATYEGEDEPRPGDDVDDVRWVAFDEISELECTPRLVETLGAWGAFD